MNAPFSSPGNRRYKVAIVYHYVAHYRKGIFQRLSRNCDVEFTIISGRETEQDIATLDDKYSRIPVNSGGIRWKFVRNIWISGFLWQVGLIKEIRKYQYDAIIFLGIPYFISTWIASLFCKLAGIRVMMWGHGFLRRETGLKGRVRTLFYSLAQTHFIYSDYSVQLMREHGLSKKSLYVVNNSLDHAEQTKMRTTLRGSASPYPNLFGDSPVLVFVGRLTPRKKIHQLIEAAAFLHQRNVKVAVFLIGDGPMRDGLELTASANQLSKFVRFHGACYNESELALFLYHADACVSPGEVGLTAIHSLTYGTPVFTHDNFANQGPEFESIMQGLNGGFFRENDVGSLANSIESWLTQNTSRAEIRENCTSVIDSSYTPEYQEKVFAAGVLEALGSAGTAKKE